MCEIEISTDLISDHVLEVASEKQNKFRFVAWHCNLVMLVYFEHQQRGIGFQLNRHLHDWNQHVSFYSWVKKMMITSFIIIQAENRFYFRFLTNRSSNHEVVVGSAFSRHASRLLFVSFSYKDKSKLNAK